MTKGKAALWKLSCGGMVILTLITFSPLIIPPGKFEPMLAGMPLTLWGGIAISIGMILMTLLAAVACSSQSDDLD